MGGRNNRQVRLWSPPPGVSALTVDVTARNDTKRPVVSGETAGLRGGSPAEAAPCSPDPPAEGSGGGCLADSVVKQPFEHRLKRRSVPVGTGLSPLFAQPPVTAFATLPDAPL